MSVLTKMNRHQETWHYNPIFEGAEDGRSTCMVWAACSSSPSSSPSPSLSRSSSSTFHPSHLCYPVSSWCCRPFETLTFLTNFEVGLKQQGNKYLPPEKCFLSACAPIHSVIIHDWNVFVGACELDLVAVGSFYSLLRCFLCRRARLHTLDDHCRALLSGRWSLWSRWGLS